MQSERDSSRSTTGLMRAEDVLRRSIDASMPAGVAAADAQGVQTHVNRAFCDMVGWCEAELLGARPPYVYWPDGTGAIERTLAQAAVGRASAREVEAKLLRRDGEQFDALLQVSPLPGGEAGGGGGWVACVYDVTERKEMEMRLRTENAVSRVLAEARTTGEALRRTLEAICKVAGWRWGALWTVDPMQGNLRCAEVWHCGEKNIEEFEALSRSTRFAAGAGLPGRVMLSAEPAWLADLPVDYFLRRGAAGRAGLHSAIGFPVLADGRVLGVMEFFSPEIRAPHEALLSMVGSVGTLVGQFLEHRYGEEALRQAERERGELLASERAARAEMERANQAKDEFLAVLSHELRTPLTPVLTAAQLLERDRTLTPHQYELVGMIRRNVQLETRLIDDLLDLTRISRGKIELFLAPADMHQKIRHVMGICDSEIRSKFVTLKLELTARRHFVMADAARLQQVVWNLLKNAVKFTPSGGCIRLRTEDTPEGRLRLRVSDNGAGIPEQLLPTIFDAFVQGGREITRQHGGLGLGLTISRRLAEMHGGTLVAESPGLGKGSTFTLELPVTPNLELEHLPLAPQLPRVDMESRILLVEDNSDTRRVMAKLLQGDGYDVRTADCVASALKAAEAEPFDVLICDIGLPDGSGLDLMRQLLSRKPIKGIAMSGFGMDEDVRRSKEAGFLEHLTKPVSLQHFESVLRRVAKGKEGPVDADSPAGPK